MKLRARLIPGVLITGLVASCSGGGGAEPTGAAPLPPPTQGQPPTQQIPEPATHGRFVGTVYTPAGPLFADALLTEDGFLRLYVGDRYLGDPRSANSVSFGALQFSKPGGSAQFVGTVAAHDSGDGFAEISGSGTVLGQGCAPPDIDRFCDESAPGEVRLSTGQSEARGELEVTTRDGTETWRLSLRAWSNYYELTARPEHISGQYQEGLAEFEQDGDVILTIDEVGQLFFQGANSGCTGNGVVAPHMDGKQNVYDIALTIANCRAPFAHLNGEFDGLGTTTPGDFWSYDSYLRLWLSSTDTGAPQAAVTMLATPL